MAWPEKVSAGVFVLCIPLWMLTLGRDWGVLGLAAVSALCIWIFCRLIAFQSGVAMMRFRSSTKRLQGAPADPAASAAPESVGAPGEPR